MISSHAAASPFFVWQPDEQSCAAVMHGWSSQPGRQLRSLREKMLSCPQMSSRSGASAGGKVCGSDSVRVRVAAGATWRIRWLWPWEAVWLRS